MELQPCTKQQELHEPHCKPCQRKKKLGAAHSAWVPAMREERRRGRNAFLRSWSLTVVPEGRATRRWWQPPACHAFVTATDGLAALRPLVAALLGGDGCSCSHPGAFSWGHRAHGRPARTVGHLLPQGLLGGHDLLALGDEGALVAGAQLPAALPGVALHRHHEAVVTAAGALRGPHCCLRHHGLPGLHNQLSTTPAHLTSPAHPSRALQGAYIQGMATSTPACSNWDRRGRRAHCRGGECPAVGRLG